MYVYREDGGGLKALNVHVHRNADDLNMQSQAEASQVTHRPAAEEAALAAKLLSEAVVPNTVQAIPSIATK